MKYSFAKRVIFYILGLLLSSFGTALASKASIGISPVSSIPLAGSIITPLSLGMCTAVFHIFCVGLQLVGKQGMSIKLVLQIPMAYAFGFLIDFFSIFLIFNTPSIGYGVLLVIASALIIGLGVRILFGVSLILMPPDALVRIISEHIGWPLSRSKFVFDLTFVAITIILTLVIMGNAFAAVGLGTIISMLMIGPTVGLCQKVFPFFDAFSSEQLRKKQ